MPREPIEDHELAASVRYLLDNEPLAVRVHEGGAAQEDLAASLSITWLKLQQAAHRPSPVAESTPTDATAVEAERDGDKCACFCPTDECQRVCTLDCPNAGARTPKES